MIPDVGIRVFKANVQAAFNVPIPRCESDHIRGKRDGLLGTPRMRRGNGAYLVMKVYGIGYMVIEGVEFVCGGLCIKRKRAGINIVGGDGYCRSPIIVVNACGPSGN